MDEETGVDPIAKDGDPDQAAADHELSQRRELKAARERAEEEQVQKRGNAIDDQPPADEDPEGDELFPLGSLEGDPKVTHKTMLKPGLPVKIRAKLSNAEVPMTDGMYPFGHRGELLVTFEAGAYKPTPEFKEEDESDGTRKVKGYKIVQNLRAVHVRSGADLLTREQCFELMVAAGLSAAKATKALGLDEKAA